MRFVIGFLLVIFVVQSASASASCSNGYNTVSNVVQSTFASPVNNVCQFSGYSLIEVPDDFEFIYNGFVNGNAVTLCNDGHLSGGNCVQFTQGSCDNTRYNMAAEQSTFAAPVNDICQFTGYSLMEIPDDFAAVYNGFINGNAITLCDNGHLSGGSCVQYTAGDCINGYYDMSINANTFAELTNGNCSSPYAKYTRTTRCDRNPGDTCVDLPTPIVNLTWDYGDGNTTSGSCVYEDLIEIPNTPTRVGYDFAGWKLETQ